MIIIKKNCLLFLLSSSSLLSWLLFFSVLCHFDPHFANGCVSDSVQWGRPVLRLSGVYLWVVALGCFHGGFPVEMVVFIFQPKWFHEIIDGQNIHLVFSLLIFIMMIFNVYYDVDAHDECYCHVYSCYHYNQNYATPFGKKTLSR